MLFLADGREPEPQTIGASTSLRLTPGLLQVALVEQDLHQRGMIVVGLHPPWAALAPRLLFRLRDTQLDFRQSALSPSGPRACLLRMPFQRFVALQIGALR